DSEPTSLISNLAKKIKNVKGTVWRASGSPYQNTSSLRPQLKQTRHRTIIWHAATASNHEDELVSPSKMPTTKMPKQDLLKGVLEKSFYSAVVVAKTPIDKDNCASDHSEERCVWLK